MSGREVPNLTGSATAAKPLRHPPAGLSFRNIPPRIGEIVGVDRPVAVHAGTWARGKKTSGRPRNPRGCVRCKLGPPRRWPPAGASGTSPVLKGVHLLLDDVGARADTSREQLCHLEDRHADFLVAIRQREAAGHVLNELPAGNLVWKNVFDALDAAKHRLTPFSRRPGTQDWRHYTDRSPSSQRGAGDTDLAKTTGWRYSAARAELEIY